MKKVFFLAVATMFAIAAGAQNRSIDAIAQNYTYRDGATVFNMEGDALKSFSQRIAGGSGTITVADGRTFNVSDLLDEIVSVTAVVFDGVNDIFSADIRGALEAADYSPIVSHNDDGTRVRMMSANIRRGPLRGNQEIVATVENSERTILVRLIGKIDTDLLASLSSLTFCRRAVFCWGILGMNYCFLPRMHE